MNNYTKFLNPFLMTVVITAANADQHGEKIVLPAKINKTDAAGMIFDREDMAAISHDDGHKTEDVTTMMSSDGKFGTGMYRSGKTRAEINEPYGVDEFMFFLKGSVTLTSSDGSVMTINAGEGVSIPKEWTGIWETDGYEKIWVIYSADGSGL
ncbi:MAG: cupin domain-containing protein [Gammaproteobacteria bacterium]|nr:cupin domain-containing protein [Gammaproteobacteria bacterium]